MLCAPHHAERTLVRFCNRLQIYGLEQAGASLSPEKHIHKAYKDHGLTFCVDPGSAHDLLGAYYGLLAER
jgi:hypothetical protein